MQYRKNKRHGAMHHMKTKHKHWDRQVKSSQAFQEQNTIITK
jgi:hypothetical protein